VSFLQKARDMARDAADATSKAAGAVAAKAQDPATQAAVKGGLSSAGQQAGVAAKGAASATTKAAGAVAAKAQDPATKEKVKGGIAAAGRGARTMVERIDPGILAEVIIKATALQETANARLREKGSAYRIAEIVVTATLPPGVSFSITRIGDRDGEAAGTALSSTQILAEEAAEDAGEAGPPEIVSLDTVEQAAIEEELAAVEASMDAAVASIEVAEGAESAPAGGPQGGADGSMPESRSLEPARPDTPGS
jgi:hypothetical protein